MSDNASVPVAVGAIPAAGGEANQQGGGAGSAPGAPQAGDVKAAATEAMRKYKVKVEGQELEVDEKELLRGYSHQKVASKSLNEGKALRKQAEEILTKLKNKDDLKSILQKLGHDPRRLSEEILASHLEDELMDPRDKELRDTKARLKQIEEMDRREKEAVQKQRHEEMKTKYMKEYEADFIQALDKSSLPPTKAMVGEMAKYISRAAKLGFKMNALEAAQLVKEDIQLAHQRLIGDADGDVLLKLLGDNVANKIRKHDTAKLKTPEQVLRTPDQAAEHRARGGLKKSTRMTPQEWRLHKRGLK